MDLKESLDRPVSEFMLTKFPTVSGDDSVSTAARSMKNDSSTEAVVLKNGEPVGIVTERDIIYKVVASGSDPSAVKVSAVMSSPVATVDESSKVGEAIAVMSKMGVRRLGVTRRGKLIGMVNQKAMVSGGLEQHVPLPELAVPNKLVCPYCGATMKDRAELSKHIDQVHLGLGLLEGNTSQW